MIQAIAFDLDDTLYPEVEFVRSGFEAVSAEVHETLGLDIGNDLLDLFAAGRRGDIFNLALARHMDEANEDYVQKLVKTYREHKPTLRPFPDCLPLLDALRGSYRLALITDGHVKGQEQKIEALGIAGYFEVIVISDRWGIELRKPHEFPFLECARRLGVSPAATVYVGDNPRKDFVTARRLGIRTIRVRRAGTLHYELRLDSAMEGDVAVANLEAVPAALRSIDSALT